MFWSAIPEGTGNSGTSRSYVYSSLGETEDERQLNGGHGRGYSDQGAQ